MVFCVFNGKFALAFKWTNSVCARHGKSSGISIRGLRTHNTLNSSQPAYLRSLLSYRIPARSPSSVVEVQGVQVS